MLPENNVNISKGSGAHIIVKHSKQNWTCVDNWFDIYSVTSILAKIDYAGRYTTIINI